jgi:hypothetical protein
MPSNFYSDQLFAIEDCMRGFVTEGGRFKHARIAGNRQAFWVAGVVPLESFRSTQGP